MEILLMNEENEYIKLKEHVKSRGLDLGFYRDPYLKRRLKLRMNKTNARTYNEYVAFVKNNPDEYQKLVDCLAVNTTSFFRDETPYQILASTVFPELLARLKEEGRSIISIWSSASSTGEEPYSIAITAFETMHAQLSNGFRLNITATDIDHEAIEKAKKGVYKPDNVSDVNDKLKRRYFKMIDGNYHIKDSIKNVVRYKYKDLIKDKPIFGSDIIFCRNMLIYIEMDQQGKIIEKLYQALNPKGYLILGKTEVLPGSFHNVFKTIDSDARIYQKSN